jgi:hypothetical protein
MTKPVKFFVINRETVESLQAGSPLSQEYLDNYLSVRPGILDDDKTDIFCRNCRSENQQWQNFSLFERTSTPIDNDTTIVFPFWLDLWYSNELHDNIRRAIDWLKYAFPANPVILQWNHDVDCASTPLQGLPDNFFILNFNTSRPRPSDILLPFWTIGTRTDSYLATKKRYEAGFIGYVGSIPVRCALTKAMRNRSDIFWERERVCEETFRELVASFRYSLCPRGGGLNSYRLYESIHLGAVPVLFADHAALPYPDLDYSEFVLRIPEADAADYNKISVAMTSAPYAKMRRRMLDLRPRFSLLGVQQEIHKRLSEYLK